MCLRAWSDDSVREGHIITCGKDTINFFKNEGPKNDFVAPQEHCFPFERISAFIWERSERALSAFWARSDPANDLSTFSGIWAWCERDEIAMWAQTDHIWAWHLSCIWAWNLSCIVNFAKFGHICPQWTFVLMMLLHRRYLICMIVNIATLSPHSVTAVIFRQSTLHSNNFRSLGVNCIMFTSRDYGWINVAIIKWSNNMFPIKKFFALD